MAASVLDYAEHTLRTGEGACRRTALRAGGRAIDSTRAAPGTCLEREPAPEGLGAVGQLHAGQRRSVRMQVVELLGQRAHAVGAGERQDLHSAQHAEGLAGAVEEATARVTGNARGQRVHRLLPAAAVRPEADARL